jgi:hypothetical protein
MYDMRILAILIGIFIIVTVIAGCTTPNATNNTTTPSTSYEKHTLICPNPDCILHNPDAALYFNGNGRAGLRPILCVQMTVGGNTYGYHYVCQVCGEEWEVKQ